MISDKLKQHEKQKTLVEEPDFHGATLNIEITSACNEKCIYCVYSAKGNHRHPNMIDEDFFYRVTKEAFELGVTDVGLYMEGEPLINPKVYEYVRYLKQELGFPYVYISTNGILCTPENIKRLAEAGIDSVKFSISSCDKDNFIRHHGVDACETVLSNIKYAHEFREKNGYTFGLYVFSIVTNFNKWEVKKMREIFEAYADEVIFRNVVDGIFKIDGLTEYLKPKESERLNGKGERVLPCNMLFDRIVIDELGYLCICCYAGEDLARVINVQGISLKDAVYSDEMRNIRKKHIIGDVEGTICNKCIFGKDEYMKPLTDKYGFKGRRPETIDRVAEIKKRFQL